MSGRPSPKRVGPTVTRTWAATIRQKQRLADETLTDEDVVESLRHTGPAPAGARVILNVQPAAFVTSPNGRRLAPVVSRGAVELIAEALLDATTVEVIGGGEWGRIVADNLEAAFLVAQAKRDAPPPPSERDSWFGIKPTDGWGPQIATSAHPDAAA